MSDGEGGHMSHPAHLRATRRLGPGTRLLLVLGLLAGLVAMHGLASGHDVPLTTDHVVVADEAALLGHPPGHLAGSTHDSPDAPSPHSGADMAQACLAVLTAVGLALLLLGPRPVAVSRRRALIRPVRPTARGSLPDPRPPDLSVLCVLRT
jgi:hypothetical protein